MTLKNKETECAGVYLFVCPRTEKFQLLTMEFKQNATAERKKYQLCRDRFHNFNVALNLHLNQGWLNFHLYIYTIHIYT